MPRVHAAKAFGAVRAVVDGSIDLYGGEAHALVGENGAGKSTVVKMLAGVHAAGRGRAAHRRQARPCSPARPPPARPASPSSTRNRPCSPTCPWPRTSSWAASRWWPPGASIAGAMRAAGRGPVRAPRRAARPGPDRPRPVHRRPADRRDRQGALAGGPGHRDGRADRRAVRRRGRPAVRRRPHAAGGRGGGAVHLAPAGGGLRDLPARHRDARRRHGADQRARGHDRRRPGARDGGPGHAAAHRRGAQRSPATRCCGSSG